MGSFSIWHWLVVLVIIIILFGAGRIPQVMGDIARGVKSFRAGLKDESGDQPPVPTTDNPDKAANSTTKAP
jgi:sec-independent protein translocase protein TatA